MPSNLKEEQLLFEVKPVLLGGELQRGLFAKQNLKANIPLLEYVGERITKKELLRREEASTSHMSYSFLYRDGEGRFVITMVTLFHDLIPL